MQTQLRVKKEDLTRFNKPENLDENETNPQIQDKKSVPIPKSMAYSFFLEPIHFFLLILSILHFTTSDKREGGWLTPLPPFPTSRFFHSTLFTPNLNHHLINLIIN